MDRTRTAAFMPNIISEFGIPEWKWVFPILLACQPLLGDMAAAFGNKRTTSTKRRPNVLLITIDDLRPALGCYGDPLARSPNLDRFSTTARQFNRAYVQQAVCGPSRTSLLTGLLPDHTRVWHNRNRFRETCPDHVTLPQFFKQKGYQTVSLGKIFSGNAKELDPVSWSRPEILRQDNWKTYVLPENSGPTKKQMAHEAADVADDAYPDGKLANLAVKTLSQLQQDAEPFFLAIGFFKPHLPFNAPKKYWNLHSPAAFAVPATVRRPVRFSPAEAVHTHRELGGYQGIPQHEDLDEDQARLLRQGYYACVSYVDVQVGKILDQLELLHLDRNTVVVIVGDHGFALGETDRWCKGTNFELDTRVPLLIRTPQLLDPGVPTESLVEIVDLYPTLTSVAGFSAEPNLDGRDFSSLFTDPTVSFREAVLSQFNRPWKKSVPEVMGYSIRTQNERYTRWIRWSSRETISEELYDYSAPSEAVMNGGCLLEQQNVASSRSKLLEQMSHRMDQLMASRLKIVKNGNSHRSKR